MMHLSRFFIFSMSLILIAGAAQAQPALLDKLTPDKPAQLNIKTKQPDNEKSDEKQESN
jgi:hypothetical protein